MNGYSGVFPGESTSRDSARCTPLLDPERAAAAINGATHVLVDIAAHGRMTPGHA